MAKIVSFICENWFYIPLIICSTSIIWLPPLFERLKKRISCIHTYDEKDKD